MNRLLLLGLSFAGLGISDCFAQAGDPAASQADPSFAEVFMQMLPVYALVIIIYYLLVLKPQQKKANAQMELKASLKKGETVVTSSGIFGKVVSVEDEVVTLELSPNVKVKFEARHVTGRPESKTSEGKTANKGIAQASNG